MLPLRYALIRLERSSPYESADSDSFFAIDASITLTKFEVAATDAGEIALTWATESGLDADIRYRLERGVGLEGTFTPVTSHDLDRTEYIDVEPGGSGARYRLVAVNGLGEEYVLGETVVAARLAPTRDIAAYPSPATGPVQITYRVLIDRLVELAVYDTAGRLVRTLVSAARPSGIHTASWDTRDGRGQNVAAGVYFVRLSTPYGHRAVERVTVLR